MSSPSPPSQTTSTVTQKAELSPEQRRLLSTATPVAERTLRNFRPFQGARVAGFSGNQRRAQQLAGQAGERQIGGANVANAALERALTGEFMYANPMLQDAINAAILPQLQQYERSILPNIQSGANLAGQPGSSRQGVAQGIASEALLRSIGDTSGQLSFRGYEQGLDTLGRALAVAPQTLATSFLPAQAIGAVGDQEQALQQLQLDTQRGAFYENQLLPLSVAQNVAGMAFGMPTGGVSSATAPTGLQSPGLFQRALGGASAGAAIGSLFPGPGTMVGAGLGALGSIFFG